MIEGTGTLTWTAEGDEIAPAWSTAYAAINALLETGIPMGVRIEVQIGRKVVSSTPAIMPPAHVNGNSVPVDPTPAALGEVRRAARPGGKKWRPAAEAPGPEMDAVVLRTQIKSGDVTWRTLSSEQRRALAGHFLSGLALEIGHPPTIKEYAAAKPEWLPTATPLVALFGIEWLELAGYAAAGQL